MRRRTTVSNGLSHVNAVIPALPIGFGPLSTPTRCRAYKRSRIESKCNCLVIAIRGLCCILTWSSIVVRKRKLSIIVHHRSGANSGPQQQPTAEADQTVPQFNANKNLIPTRVRPPFFHAGTLSQPSGHGKGCGEPKVASTARRVARAAAGLARLLDPGQRLQHNSHCKAASRPKVPR